MERLTNNINYCQLHCDFGKEKDCLFTDKSKCYENNMYNKLREYEIAEEQGLLLKLPCNVGDTLYFVENGEVFEFVVYSFDIRPLQRFVRDYYGMSLNFSKFNKTVFLTKEEAEQALAEMKGE